MQNVAVTGNKNIFPYHSEGDVMVHGTGVGQLFPFLNPLVAIVDSHQGSRDRHCLCLLPQKLLSVER